MDFKKLQPIWRAGALALAQSLRRVFPNCELGEGGAWDLGFYQEIVLGAPLDKQVLSLVEESLRGVVKENLEVRTLSMLPDNAAAYLRHHGEKKLASQVEKRGAGLVEVGKLESLHLVMDGEAAPATGEVGVIKILGAEPIEGGYRIEATSAPDKKSLKELAALIQEAKERDHQRLGEEMGLWWQEKSGWCWAPQGVQLRHNIWCWWQEAVLGLGAGIVKMTGPWNGLAPPLENHRRAAEKWNKTGIGELLVLKGDAEGRGLLNRQGQTTHAIHLFPHSGELDSSLISSLQFIDQAIKMFGFAPRWCLSFSGKKTSQKRRNAARLRDAAHTVGLALEEEDALEPFPGVILEARVKDAQQREWSCSRLGLYSDESAEGVVFLNLMGSVDRLAALLVETQKGHFPLWLTPEPVRILAMGEGSREQAQALHQILRSEGIEAGLDTSQEKLGSRVFATEKARIPYTVIIGSEERAKEQITVRPLGKDPIRGIKPEDFVRGLIQEMKEKAMPGKMVAIRKNRA